MQKKTSKSILRIVVLVSTAISLYFVPWPILKAYLTPTPDTIQEQVEKGVDYGFVGVIAYVDQPGLQSKGFAAGYNNRDLKTPASPDLLFKIASVSKLYTALAITKLATENRLDLNKTVADYFPELANRIENADKITISMMVRHRSGIPNFTDTYMYWANPKETNEERLALILDKPANFAPDTDEEYCNTNYLLLAELIKKITGADKSVYIKQSILDPLGLKNTYGSIHDVDLNRVMSGYYVGYDKDLKTDDNDLMIATAQDVAAFVRALNDGTAFSSKKEQETYLSLYKLEHTGLIPGYQTIVKYHKDIDAVVVLFTNTVNFEGYEWNLSEILYNKIVKILEKQASL